MNMSKQERDRRYTAIRQIMNNNDLDCLVAVSRDTYFTRGNTRYICNHGNDEGEEVVVFPREEMPIVFAPAMREASIKRAGWIDNIVKVNNDTEKIEVVKNEVKRFEGGNKVGIVGMTYISALLYLAIEAVYNQRVVSLDKEFSQLRSVKSDEEITMMRTSALIADKAFAHVRDMLKPGITDYKIYSEAKQVIHEMGCDYSMEFMVGGYPYGAVYQAHDMFLLEFSPCYQGYYAQLPVTLAVDGYPSDIQTLIPVWKNVFKAGVDNLRPGNKASDVHNAVIQSLLEQGYANIGHRSGHALGLDVLDGWEISSSDDTVLKPGMTVVFHPAVVDESRGFRFLEPGGTYFIGGYTYVITEEGAEKLSTIDTLEF